MEERMLAQGWSRARIAEVLGSAREPEPEPQQGSARGGKCSARRPRPPGKPRELRERHAAAAAALEAQEVGEPGIHASPKARRRSAAAAAAATPRRLDGSTTEQDLSQLGPRARRRAQAAAAIEDARRNRHRDRTAAKKAGSITVAPPSQDFTPGGKRLTPASVYVRIRPLAAEGGHADGEAVRKQLESWTDTSVTIGEEFMFSKGEAEYRFPKKVFGPEVDQDGVWEGGGGPELVEQFTRFGGHNVIYFAYGQTGAGKTHTMLGTDESLWAPLDAGEAVDPGWGIFPRACYAIFEAMEQSGRTYAITASAVEFYMCECLDLLEPDPEVKLQVDASTHSVCGAKRVTLSKMADLLPFLEQVQMNRTTRSTAMNRADGEHGGSSRSHAALILTLTQLDDSGENVATTTFTLMDLAGAERPSKTKEKRFSGGEMLLYLMNKDGTSKAGGGRVGDPLNRPTTIPEIPTGCQALVINMELYGVGAEVLKATECHCKGQKYRPPKQLTTPAVKFLTACFDGTAVAHMCVCVSPAGQNGWETWFSLQYGTDLAGLRAPIQAQKGVPYSQACAEAAKAARAARVEFDGSAKNKYWEGRRIKAIETAHRLADLESLRSMSC